MYILSNISGITTFIQTENYNYYDYFELKDHENSIK